MPRRLRRRHQGQTPGGRILRAYSQGHDGRPEAKVEGESQRGVGRIHGEPSRHREAGRDLGDAQRQAGRHGEDRIMERPLGRAPVSRHERAAEGHRVSDGHGRLRYRPFGLALQQGQPARRGQFVYADTT